jgi:hypothetical protein
MENFMINTSTDVDVTVFPNTHIELVGATIISDNLKISSNNQ